MAPIPGTAPTAARVGTESVNSVGSLLLLDKSELSFETQLGEACRLIGVDPLSFHDEYRTIGSIPHEEMLQNRINGPRYEWTLKWILSKIYVDIHPGCPCLVPKTWFLFLFLIMNLDTVKVAHILADKKYLGAIRRTLGWLRKEVGRREFFPEGCCSNSSSEEGRSSKKRKRSQNESQGPGPDQTTFELLTALILPICETLNQTQCLVKSESEASSTVEQLKNCLRCSTEEAANIASDALYLQGVISYNISRCDMTSDGMRVARRRWESWDSLSYFKTYVDFWSLQVPVNVDVSHSNFVSHEGKYESLN